MRSDIDRSTASEGTVDVTIHFHLPVTINMCVELKFNAPEHMASSKSLLRDMAKERLAYWTNNPGDESAGIVTCGEYEESLFEKVVEELRSARLEEQDIVNAHAEFEMEIEEAIEDLEEDDARNKEEV